MTLFDSFHWFNGASEEPQAAGMRHRTRSSLTSIMDKAGRFDSAKIWYRRDSSDKYRMFSTKYWHFTHPILIYGCCFINGYVLRTMSPFENGISSIFIAVWPSSTPQKQHLQPPLDCVFSEAEKSLDIRPQNKNCAQLCKGLPLHYTNLQCHAHHGNL